MANFCFADGHVKTNKIGAMAYRNFANLPDGDADLDKPAVSSGTAWTYP